MDKNDGHRRDLVWWLVNYDKNAATDTILQELGEFGGRGGVDVRIENVYMYLFLVDN